jgi:hypothetical protein
MSSEADETGLPPDDFEGDPLLASLVRDADRAEGEDGLSIIMTVGGIMVSGKLGSLSAYRRHSGWHLDQGAERDRAGIRAAFRVSPEGEVAEPVSSGWPAYVHVKDVRFFDATGASVPRGTHWPSVWWRGRISAVDGWTLGELRPDEGETD